MTRTAALKRQRSHLTLAGVQFDIELGWLSDREFVVV